MKITKFFIERPTLFWSLMVGIIIAGVLSFIQMPKLEDPAVATKQAMVVVMYPGASAHDVELEVAQLLEDELRNLPDVTSADPATPLLSSIRRKKSEAPQSDGISRSGLYRVLCDFFEAAAAEVQERSAADAAKLRAGSTHWLRHTFATNALKTMDINLVQNAMGHASIGTTSRYLTPEESQIAQAMKKLPAL